jgi:mRNA-degrading endonuclease RelE of RelBE toxin-antitoxin system
MKPFTVTWHPDAEHELTSMWVASDERKRVTLAVATIDKQLASDPEGRGHAVREGLLRLDVPPLRVLFAVKAEDRVVVVLMVAVIANTFE